MKKKRNALAIVSHVAVAAKINREFNYKIVRSARRTLSVEVRGDLVVVRSPLILPKFVINKFLLDKHSWIVKNLKSPQKRLKQGVLFLGREVLAEYGPRDEITENKLFIRVLGNSELEKKTKLEAFYLRETKNLVEKNLKNYKKHFDFGQVKYKRYFSRWGSCSPKDDLSFNSRLSMCPEKVIEYIVVHELCHTKVKNHSGQFYEEVASYMPQYKSALSWLRRNRGLI